MPVSYHSHCKIELILLNTIFIILSPDASGIGGTQTLNLVMMRGMLYHCATIAGHLFKSWNKDRNVFLVKYFSPMTKILSINHKFKSSVYIRRHDILPNVKRPNGIKSKCQGVQCICVGVLMVINSPDINSIFIF